jgi:ketosteroid isomerase-like protein
MAKPARSTISLLSFLVASACGPSPEGSLSAAHSAAIGDSVRATLSAFIGRMEATDGDSIARFYADDPRFTWTANGAVVARTVAQIRAGITALAGYPRWRLEYLSPTVVPLAAGVAAVTTNYTQTLTDSAGKDLTFGGALTLLWIHTPGGWKILQGHSSSPPPAR